MGSKPSKRPQPKSWLLWLELAEGIAVPSGPEDLKHIELLLLSCDMVKFARYLPSRAENDEAVKGSLQVLLDCRSRRQPARCGRGAGRWSSLMFHFADPWFLLLYAPRSHPGLALLPARTQGRGQPAVSPPRLHLEGVSPALDGPFPSHPLRNEHARPRSGDNRAWHALRRGPRKRKSSPKASTLSSLSTPPAAWRLRISTPRNRLMVAKLVVRSFVEGLRHDRVGLVVFAGKVIYALPLDAGLRRPAECRRQRLNSAPSRTAQPSEMRWRPA